MCAVYVIHTRVPAVDAGAARAPAADAGAARAPAVDAGAALYYQRIAFCK